VYATVRAFLHPFFIIIVTIWTIGIATPVSSCCSAGPRRLGLGISSFKVADHRFGNFLGSVVVFFVDVEFAINKDGTIQLLHSRLRSAASGVVERLEDIVDSASFSASISESELMRLVER